MRERPSKNQKSLRKTNLFERAALGKPKKTKGKLRKNIEKQKNPRENKTKQIKTKKNK